MRMMCVTPVCICLMLMVMGIQDVVLFMLLHSQEKQNV